MDLIKIYEDKDLEVITFDFVVSYLENYINDYKKLLPLQQEEVLSLIFKELSEKYDLKSKRVITSSVIPVLHRGKIFDLVDGYSQFQDAILLLSEAFDLTKGKLSEEWKNNLKNYIISHYYLTFQKKCDIIFFVEKVYEISLEIVLIEDDKIFILPVSLNEDDFYQKLT